MNKLLFLLLIILVSCSKPEKKVQSEKKEHIVATNSENAFKPSKQLDKKLRGEWINVALFDSTLTHKKLEPWLSSFYGDIYLKIDRTDSVDIEGNMDGALTTIIIENPFQFKMPGRADKPVFTFDEELNRIIQTSSEGQKIIFRRKNNADDISFMADEGKFNNFFLKKLFEGDYLELTNSGTNKISTL